eukprot:CAMPEP_0113522820 /NCGR_PEP_ID=MMETSP0014_2-20120614/45390_1 /TAXON_ID=2857 /ORGANISM="Nitzschia sp." /LENGTH=465 /DNA_ID=CAMNT_0000420897 /DNA_START=119 /DNA_END=1512 /DNA_ORIENTATION=+ /assembly_acc=CAM_ASM_000159
MSAAGKFTNGQGGGWTDVQDPPPKASGVNVRGAAQTPVFPVMDGDGKIFVSVPSFRDGDRCGKTLIDLFAKAKEPERIVVGLVEQNYEENDPYCLESYCKEAAGLEIYRRQTIRKDTTKIIAKVDRDECPHIHQIRKVAVHNVAAKGPSYARSLARKVLGNEEFCMQTDAHMTFAQDWDVKLLQEWAATENEFAVISTVPLNFKEQGTTPEFEVPRNCAIDMLDTGIPSYTQLGDGKVQDLKKPLLAHTWNPGFSFAKCHLEESAPYDGLSTFVAGIESFGRFARMWTRGYDVYTPTRNIVFHNYQANPNGHGVTEWMKPRYQRFRDIGIRRMRTFLGFKDGLEDFKVDNLGIYGIGKRRSLEQLGNFIGIDMSTPRKRPHDLPCGNFAWVPYDPNISPVENLYDNPDDLDPQPEYPLRTKMVYYKEVDAIVSDLEILEGDLHPAQREMAAAPLQSESGGGFPST